MLWETKDSCDPLYCKIFLKSGVGPVLEGIPVLYNMSSLLTAHYGGHLQMRSVKVLFRECHSLLPVAMVNVRTKSNLARKEFISSYS